MNERSFVVVFPSIFSKNKIPQLVSNIKKILGIHKQKFRSVKRDGKVILVDANDPVFASSAISQLFGIEKTIIARQTKNDFDSLVSEITSLGGNLLLKGDRFLVRVEGTSRGFLTKDVEISATSSIIEKKSKLGARPGTDENFDKMLYAFLTKGNAYVSIFLDDGLGGIPYGVHKKKAICAVYDELSASACLETIRQGFVTEIVVCYKQKSELTRIAKILNRILPRLLEKNIDLEFYKIFSSRLGSSGYLLSMRYVLEILLHKAKNEKIEYVSFPISPLIFPEEVVDSFTRRIFQDNKLALLPLYGADKRIFDNLKEIGLEKNIPRLESIVLQTFKELPEISKEKLELCLNSREKISVAIGPNNVHDILDALE